MSRLRLIALVTVLLSAATLAQAPIRIASLAPQNSVWGKHLDQMAAEWAKAGAPATVYPDGRLGSDPDVVEKMVRLGTPQAAALTIVGLAKIDPAFNVFTMPFFFASYDELYAVMDKLTPVMSERLDKKGIVLLSWGQGGWAQLFTTKPVKTVAEAKAIKLFTSAGDESMMRLYTSNGFNPRALEMTDIMTSLGSGLIEGMPSPATAALSFQWFRQTKYMLDVGVAPVTGALVITKKQWNTIPEATRAKLLASAKGLEDRLEKEIPVSERNSIEAMKSRGLVVNTAAGPEWKALGETFSQAMLSSNMVPRDVYDMAVRERNAFRAKK
jgi:TRAP-type C4-dicarboxylate transport system substrate-binding protein